jgi:hypothetical protein
LNFELFCTSIRTAEVLRDYVADLEADKAKSDDDGGSALTRVLESSDLVTVEALPLVTILKPAVLVYVYDHVGTTDH